MGETIGNRIAGFLGLCSNSASSYLREMIDNSWAWARANGQIRIHPVHKKEEARLVLNDWFEDKEEKGEERNLKGKANIKDHHGSQLGIRSLLKTMIHCINWLYYGLFVEREGILCYLRRMKVVS